LMSMISPQRRLRLRMIGAGLRVKTPSVVFMVKSLLTSGDPHDPARRAGS